MLLAGPAAASHDDPAPAQPLGLMGTIPVFWGEAAGVEDLIGGTAEAHWAKAELGELYDLQPLDYLDAATLEGFDRLLLAQPRALSGEENVALDAWVRSGGQVLLFADPMMTGHSRFAIGDRRRPMDVTLLSPILAHWGLTMEFSPDAAPGPQTVGEGEAALPVNLPGRFTLAETAPCILAADAVIAVCALGAGRATVVADAAMLDLHEPDPAAPAALKRLLRQAFAPSGENAGR